MAPHDRPNWRVFILPYLDQAPLYNTLQLNGGGFFAHSPAPDANGQAGFSGNTVLRFLRIPVYNCPSSSLPNFANASGNSYNSMSIHYVGISGATPDPAGRTNVCTGDFLASTSSHCRNGLMPAFESRRIRDCTDGTSNTMILAEQSGRVNNVDRTSNPLGAWHGIGNSPGGWNAGTTLPLTADQGFCYPSGITTVRFTPNAYNRTGAVTQANTQYSFNTVINSEHVGGVHVLMADGAVRFVSDNINFTILTQLCVCDDGQVIGEF